MTDGRGAVLVVEDEVLIRIELVDALRDSGISTFEAASADEALKVFEAMPDVMVVVTDIRMPGTMDGIGLARRMKERWPHVKVIIVSGTLPVSIAGVADHAFAKPYKVEDLVRYVRTHLQTLPKPPAEETA